MARLSGDGRFRRCPFDFRMFVEFDSSAELVLRVVAWYVLEVRKMVS